MFSILTGLTLDEGNSLCIKSTNEIVINESIAERMKGKASETSTSLAKEVLT